MGHLIVFDLQILHNGVQIVLFAMVVYSARALFYVSTLIPDHSAPLMLSMVFFVYLV
jgi:hypothetical protein